VRVFVFNVRKETKMVKTDPSHQLKKELILRDRLALDRTLLANERTLLAYFRSAITLIIAGVSILHFAPYHTWFWTIGLCCVPLGILTAVIGFLRYSKMNKSITSAREEKSSLPDGNE